MTFWYRLLIRLATPLVFVYLWLRGAKAPAYRQRWAERLAKQTVPAQARDGIIIHCVSVGETVAARGLIEAVLAAYPHLPVTLTSMTPTAYDLAQKLFGERVFHSYLPIDTPRAMRRFFDKFSPRLIIILETELWPCMLAQATLRQTPVMVVNARMSERSAKGYKKYAWLVGPIWQQVSFIAAQTQASAENFKQLGVAQQQLAVRGNLKHDIQVPLSTFEQAAHWREKLQRPILLAASTHQGEDEQVLAAFKQILSAYPTALLMIVPRHPERFDSVAQLIEQQQLCYTRRSFNEAVLAKHQVFLADTMGELMLWYALADIAFVGGSLIERGGHNPLEPIATKTPVVSGPYIFNFESLFARLEQCQGVRFANNAQQLADVWGQLLAQPELATELATRAEQEFKNDQGATAAMLDDILTVLTAPDNSAQRTMFMMKTENPDKNTTIWFAPDILPECPSSYFEPEYWQQLNKVKGSATGRSTAFFVDAGAHGLLLRHYYRGGLVGKFNKDRFKREAIPQSRAMAEFSLLLKLRELKLPVPRPVAARHVKAPLWGYRADILVEVIPNAQDTFKVLQQRQLTAQEWQLIGKTIRQLHDAGVYHSDLNCHNIMLDADGAAWIVDFDKCGFKQAGEWREANLERLLRSLNKELNKAKEANRDFHFDETRDWPLLERGYRAN